MAKNTKSSNLPKGFQTLGMVPVAGWYILREGNTVQGVLEDSFIVNGGKFGPKKIYKVKLTMSGAAAMGGENGKTEVTLDEGDVIGIDEKGFLKALANVEKGREVYIECTGKGKAKAGQSAPWTFELGVK